MCECYLCGNLNATHQYKFKDSFTGHSLAKCPESNVICDRCNYSLDLRANYLNPHKQKEGKEPKYSALYARNWSWLYQGEKLIYPTFNGEIQGLPIVENLPTRELLREWIMNPPQPPFTIAIAESGQKHILFLAQEANNRELFPVQFEIDTVIINRKEFIKVINSFESLMKLGATKTEIYSGDYKSQFLMDNLDNYSQFEDIICPYRGSRFFDLVRYVAIAERIEQPEVKQEITIKQTIKKPLQLTLF